MSTPADERIILSILAESGGMMVPERKLYLDGNAASATPITLSSLRQILSRLEAKAQAIGIPGDDGVKWKISAGGQARLAEAHL